VAADIASVGAAQLTVVNPAPGGGISNPVGFAVLGAGTAPVPGYLYVANSYDGTISAFTIDPGSGSLGSILGSPFAVPGGPFLDVYEIQKSIVAGACERGVGPQGKRPQLGGLSSEASG
jgi:hypothetical protein